MNLDADASTALTLQLTYQDYGINYTSSCLTFSVDVSVDGGSTWTPTTVTTSLTCSTRNIDLSAYIGHSTLRVRFTFTAAARCGANAEWHPDEIRIHGLIRNY